MSDELFFKQRVTTEQDAWHIRIGKTAVPISIFVRLTQPLTVIALCLFAYNMGNNAAMEYVKIAAFMGTPHCNVYGNCISYELVQSGTRLNWVEKPINNTIKNYVKDNTSWQ